MTTMTNATDSAPFTFTPGQEVYIRDRGKIHEGVYEHQFARFFAQTESGNEIEAHSEIESERIRVAPRTSAGLSYLLRQLQIVEADLYAEIKRVKELRDRLAIEEGL